MELTNYILRRIQSTEDSVKSINRIIRRQMRFNKTVAVFILVMTAYTIAMETRNREQVRKIKELGGMKGD